VAEGRLAPSERGVVLATAGHTLKVPLDGDDQRSTWEALVSLCQARVEPRLIAGALAGLDRGEAFAVKPVTVRPDGFSVATALRAERAYPWDEFGRADLQSGSVRLYLADRLRPVGCVPLRQRNAVLLPDLLDRAGRRARNATYT
jgi:hypothetical protein